jgi:hypothetical protein
MRGVGRAANLAAGGTVANYNVISAVISSPLAGCNSLQGEFNLLMPIKAINYSPTSSLLHSRAEGAEHPGHLPRTVDRSLIWDSLKFWCHVWWWLQRDLVGPPQLHPGLHPVMFQNYFVLLREHSLFRITKANQFMLFTEITVVCCDSHTSKINTQRVQFLM